jgi:hypothetical protein
MTTRTVIIGLAFAAIGIGVAKTAAAQDVRFEGRARTALSWPWRNLDFGKPKSAPAASHDTGRVSQAVLMPHRGAQAATDASLLLSTPPAGQTQGCAPASRPTHSGPGWFAPSLPPLPSVPLAQPIFGHHSQPIPVIVPSCKAG